MKQKKLKVLMLLCIIVMFFSVSIVNAGVVEAKVIIKKNIQSPAQKFYQNFLNNSFSSSPLDVHVKNVACENILDNLFKLANIPHLFRIKKKCKISLKLSKVPYDFIISFIVLQKNLKIELDGDKIIISDKEN